MPTLKDVAREAGLSVTTASRALNHYSDVAEKTRERVARVAAELGYHPNHIARSLQGTRTHAIGLVIPTLVHRYLDSFWLEFIGGVTSACMEAGFDLLLCTGKDLHDEYAQYERLVNSRRVDGVIVCDVRVRDPRISLLCKNDATLVAFGRVLGEDGYSWVDVDGAGGVRAAMEHLLLLGHQRIAYLSTPPAFSFTHFRFEGYLQALFAAGIEQDANLVVEDLDVTSDLEGPVRALLALDRPPTAILACADFLAIGALRALRALGKRVPDDVSLIAFDDTLATLQADPPLTCVRQDNQAIGRHVAITLTSELLGEAQAPVQILVQPCLVVRGSTAPPPA